MPQRVRFRLVTLVVLVATGACSSPAYRVELPPIPTASCRVCSGEGAFLLERLGYGPLSSRHQAYVNGLFVAGVTRSRVREGGQADFLSVASEGRTCGGSQSMCAPANYMTVIARTVVMDAQGKVKAISPSSEVQAHARLVAQQMRDIQR